MFGNKDRLRKYVVITIVIFAIFFALNRGNNYIFTYQTQKISYSNMFPHIQSSKKTNSHTYIHSKNCNMSNSYQRRS